MKIETEQIERMIRQEQIKFMIAVLELCTRIMAAGKEIRGKIKSVENIKLFWLVHGIHCALGELAQAQFVFGNRYKQEQFPF